MASRAREAREWPYSARRAWRSALDKLAKAADLNDQAIDSVDRGRTAEVTNAYQLLVARIISDVRRELTEAGNGAPDDLRIAIETIRSLRDGATPEAYATADELLYRYDES